MLVEWKVQSTTNLETEYTISILTRHNYVACTCPGFRSRGRCKHIKFYKRLIKDLMHETPGRRGGPVTAAQEKEREFRRNKICLEENLELV